MNLTKEGLSVVIATLGGSSLEPTIISLNSGILIPDEILICIPKKFIYRIRDLGFNNVRVVSTPFQGQVAQRAEGFKQACYKFVLQLDDDIELFPDTLINMASTLKDLGRLSVVGPIFIDKITKKSIYIFPTGLMGSLISIYLFVFSGLPYGKSRMGKISSIGVNCSVDPKFFTSHVINTDWLAGGCVLGYRDELIIDTFFPYHGKAYLEDVMHSVMRTRKGVNHHLVTNAYVGIDKPTSSFTWIEFLRKKRMQFYIVKFMRGNKIRKALQIGLDSILILVISLIRKANHFLIKIKINDKDAVI
jgi:glycosyltransferase involved in cell wall biosynthesis